MGNANNKTDTHGIDFVLPWVDGSDKEWMALKRRYENPDDSVISSDKDVFSDWRYRDYGLLRYWFRAVERFAPWVNRVFFVTCGQKPDWLDESNPKLRLVNHKDYIPADYLPTFQSNTIELNLYRIADLSEQFVLFNDDTFLLRPVEPEFFFKKGLPVIPCDLGVPHELGYNNISRVEINNSGVLKLSLDVEHLIRKNIRKYVNLHELGIKRAAKNFLSFAINRVVIFNSFGHMPQNHLKSTFSEIWRVKPQVMDTTSRSRFRGDDNVNQWLACAWNMVSGRFYPANEKRRGVFYYVNADNLNQICDTIRRQASPQICLSDKDSSNKMEQFFHKVAEEFDKLLPDKSSFEK